MIDNITFDGRLNKDDDILPKGDYSDARNVTILQPSASGGNARSIKKMESVNTAYGDSVAGTLVNPSIISQVVDPDGNLYVLVKGDTNASICKIEPDETSTTRVVYNHDSCTVEEPDLKFIDNILIWNYYGSGVPLQWLVTRAPKTVTDTRDIFFIKAPPVYPPTVTEVTSLGSFSSISGKQFQFATRYVWDTGDVSVLSPISKLFGGEDEVSSFIVNPNASEPAMNYVDKVEFLAREGNSGEWKRFLTRDYGVADESTPYNYSSLDDVDANWTTFGSYTGSYLSFREGNESSFLLSDLDDGDDTDGINRGLGNLIPGSYTLSIKAGAFETQNATASISVTFKLWDFTAGVSRATLTFNKGDAGEEKTASYTIASNSELDLYLLRVEYTQTQTGSGDVVWNFDDIKLREITKAQGGFHGQSFETISNQDAVRQFDFVPYSTQAIEIQDNRVFFANNREIETGNESSIEINITDATDDYRTGSSYRYNVTEAESLSNKQAPIKRGHANESRYSFGVVYYDRFLRTRGLETQKGWTSPKFGVGVADVGITRKTDIPSWAEYYSVVRTKNLDKDFIYEGYASGVHFMVEQPSTVASDSQVIVERTYQKAIVEREDRFDRSSGERLFSAEENTRVVQEAGFTGTTETRREDPEIKISTTEGKLIPFAPYTENGIDYNLSTASNVKYFVIDIQGMLKAGRFYNFSNGDLITGHFLSANEQFLDKLDVVTMKIEYQQGNLLYCDPAPMLQVTTNEVKGYARASLTVDITEDFFFEIYSPSQARDSRYYAIGDIHPISELTALSVDASLTKTIEGDTYWSEKEVTIPESGYIYEPAYAKLDASASASVVIGDGGASGVNPEARLVLDTETSNYTNNADFSLNDGLISIHKGGAYRVYLEVDFTVAAVTNIFTDGVTYATVELRRSNNHEVLATAVFNSDATTGSKTISTTTTFEGGSGDSLYITVIGRQYGGGGSNTTATVAFTLDHLIIGSAENLVGNLTFGLKRKSLGNTNTKSFIFKSTSPNGDLLTWNTDIGKPYTLISNKSNTGLERRIRFGGKKLVNSGYSRLSSFQPLDVKDIGNESGSITALQSSVDNQNEGGVILAICKNETISVYIGVRAMQTGDGGTQLIQSNDVIAATRTLIGGFGCSHKRSISLHRGRVCWWDENNKSVVRYTREGLYPISEFKMSSFFQGKSGLCTGWFDPFYNYYHIKFDSDNYSTAFDMDQRWVSHYDIRPGCRGVNFNQFSFLPVGTQVYRSLGSGYNSFMGVTGADPYIQLAANYPTPVELTGLVITSDSYIDYTESNYVKSGVLTARVENTNSGGQYSEMTDRYFIYEDGNIYTHVYMDQNQDQFTGAPLVGAKNKIKLTLTDNTTQDNIRQVLLNSEKSFGHIV